MDQPFEEFLNCRNDFKYFLANYIKINDCNRGIIPCALYPYQDRLFEDYQKHRFNVVIKFRQGGFTTFTVLYALWLSMFYNDQKILFLTKTDREACQTSKIIQKAIQHMPEWLKPSLLKDNDHEKKFSITGSRINFFSPQAVCSTAFTLVVVDEAAFIPKMYQHWQALYPVLSTGGKAIVLSTPNGMGNWFQEIVFAAREQKNQFHVCEVSYKDHPDYQDPKWVEQIKSGLGPKGFLQEVECQFLGALPDKQLTRAFEWSSNLTLEELSFKLKELNSYFIGKKEYDYAALLHETIKRLTNQTSSNSLFNATAEGI